MGALSSLRKLFILSCCVVCIILPSCLSESYVKEQGMIWNTTYHITFKGPSELGDSVLAVLEDVGKSLNVFNKTSLVSRANEADSTIIDRHFKRVYQASMNMNSASNGMFDPTLSPLITAWGFGPGHEISPDTLAIDSILDFVGIGKTRLKGDMLVKEDRRIQFNFSAIAKGYGCDAVADMLVRNGVTDYMVEIGGEIATGGHSPKGGPWRISVDKPIETDSTEIHDSALVIELTNAGIATSGNYRNFRKDRGKTFGHTISPMSGRPVATDVVSATVVANSAMEADAAATACMAAGSSVAREILQKLHIEGMLILSDSTVWMSPGFKSIVSTPIK